MQYITAPICVDPTYPYFRFFAKNVNANAAGLEVEVISYNSQGKIQKTSPVNYNSVSGGWLPMDWLHLMLTVVASYRLTYAAPHTIRAT